jgi:cytochrome P450
MTTSLHDTTASGLGSAEAYDHLIPEDCIQITGYEEAVEVYRNLSFGQVVDGGTFPFRGGTILRIDGAPHHQRRKTMSALVKRDGHTWFREHVLVPTTERLVRELRCNPDDDGLVRCDFAVFARQIFIDLSSALVGLNPIESPEQADDLVDLVDGIFGVLSLRWQLGDKDAVVRRGAAARDGFDERFYRPALERHRQMLAEVDAGTRDAEDVPKDLLTLIAAHADVGWMEPDLGLRETMLLLNASLDTGAVILVHALHEAFQWFDSHPEDEALKTDPELLLGIVNETLRLHPVGEAFFRRALEDVTLRSGREVQKGQLVALRSGIASRDASIYGPDADQFNPRRAVPAGNVYPYGLSFGTGVHMCLGLPIILGMEGPDGSHVHLLQVLLDAGIRPDPDHPARPRDEIDRDMYESFPVILPGP